MAIQEFVQTITGLTTVTTIYTAGDQLGNGMSFPNVVSNNGEVCKIVAATVTDDSGVLGAFDLVIYNSALPVFQADNSPAAISVAEGQTARAALSFLAANLVNDGGRIIGNMVPITPVPVKVADASKTMFVGLIARTANAVFAVSATSIRVALLIDRS